MNMPYVLRLKSISEHDFEEFATCDNYSDDYYWNSTTATYDENNRIWNLGDSETETILFTTGDWNSGYINDNIHIIINRGIGGDSSGDINISVDFENESVENISHTFTSEREEFAYEIPWLESYGDIEQIRIQSVGWTNPPYSIYLSGAYFCEATDCAIVTSNTYWEPAYLDSEFTWNGSAWVTTWIDDGYDALTPTDTWTSAYTGAVVKVTVDRGEGGDSSLQIAAFVSNEDFTEYAEEIHTFVSENQTHTYELICPFEPTYIELYTIDHSVLPTSSSITNITFCAGDEFEEVLTRYDRLSSTYLTASDSTVWENDVLKDIVDESSIYLTFSPFSDWPTEFQLLDVLFVRFVFKFSNFTSPYMLSLKSGEGYSTPAIESIEVTEEDQIITFDLQPVSGWWEDVEYFYNWVYGLAPVSGNEPVGGEILELINLEIFTLE